MLELPSAIFYLPLPIGSALMALAFLLVAAKAILGANDATVSNLLATGSGDTISEDQG